MISQIKTVLFGQFCYALADGICDSSFLDGRGRHSWYLCYCIVCYIVTKNYKPILKRYKSKNNVRNGIAHDKVSAHPKAYECSMKREQLPTWIDYVICKENSKKDYLDKGLRERGKLCKHKITNQGCLTCGDYVCKNHWDSQEYKHKWNAPRNHH